ncbi:MAG: NAD(P)-dependent dehydrogenase (short-subunit alcohol dehydrogenase family) [Hyphomicrobiaceae bacterium]|jgi:NAD(P)-dependent dehydrogenase (short-subunit alcohol dehydrogenase family)
MQLQGQSVLVTGAANGIGRAIALGMARAGADVAASDLDKANVSTLKAEIETMGRKCIAIEADAGDVAAIDAMVSQTVDVFGKIDVIVNNAGVTRRAQIMDLTEDDFDRMNRVNTKGVFFCMQRAAKEMIKQGGGRIINIASIAGKGFAGSSNVIYAGTKGAVIAMTRLGSVQLGPHNITVNAVCPGVTETAIYDAIMASDAEKQGVPEAEVRAKALEKIPLRRSNTPGDIADMCVFLASDAARNVSGQSLHVDGALVPD